METRGVEVMRNQSIIARGVANKSLLSSKYGGAMRYENILRLEKYTLTIFPSHNQEEGVSSAFLKHPPAPPIVDS